jgi:hypothetical protein
MTVILSRYFLLNEPKIDLKCVIIITIGIFISIIPNLVQLSTFTDFIKNNFLDILYPCIYALSVLPNVLMNITQKHIFVQCPHFNKNLMLFGESIFQFITIGLCFWFDLIPYIGTSKNINEFEGNFIYGSQCFFFPFLNSNVGHLCHYSMLIGLLFALSYYGVYYYNSHLIDQVSVGFNSIIQIISTPIQMYCWFLLAPYLTWACIESHNQFQITMATIALPFIMYGSYIYYSKVEEAKHSYVIIRSVVDV